MNLFTRILSFPDRLLYRWYEDEYDEVQQLRDKLSAEGVPAVALALEVGMVEQMHKLTAIAHRLRARGVAVEDYAMGNAEMLWSFALAAAAVGGLLVSVTHGAV
jgi:hypothetical protein